MTGAELRAATQRTSTHTACGCDGWRRDELLALPLTLWDSLADVLRGMAAGAIWHPSLITVVTSLIPKRANADFLSAPGDLRPISVASLIYRAWGSVLAGRPQPFLSVRSQLVPMGSERLIPLNAPCRTLCCNARTPVCLSATSISSRMTSTNALTRFPGRPCDPVSWLAELGSLLPTHFLLVGVICSGSGNFRAAFSGLPFDLQTGCFRGTRLPQPAWRPSLLLRCSRCVSVGLSRSLFRSVRMMCCSLHLMLMHCARRTTFSPHGFWHGGSSSMLLNYASGQARLPNPCFRPSVCRH